MIRLTSHLLVHRANIQWTNYYLQCIYTNVDRYNFTVKCYL